MKVLLVHNGKGWSGGQEHLKNLATELRDRGVEVHFQVRGDTVNETRFLALGFPVRLTPFEYGSNAVKAFFRLVSVLRRERFDIVSIHRDHDLPLTVLAFRLAFLCGRHGRLMMSYHLPTVRKQPLLGTIDAVVSISEHVKANCCRAIPLPPPGPEKFSVERPRRFFHGKGFPIIGMVGEFWKNQMELVEMVPLLRQAFPEITVALVGNNKPALSSRRSRTECAILASRRTSSSPAWCRGNGSWTYSTTWTSR